MVANTNNNARILIVDDEPNNLKVLHTLLTENGYHVHALRDSRSTMAAAEDLLPDLILLDINMPYMNGYDVCDALKRHSDTADIPIIFISARSEQHDIVKGFEAGGQDYITKPIQYHEVLARVKTHVDLYEQQRLLEEKLALIEEIRRNEEARFAKISDMRNQFIQAATHDLKNPLYTIMGYADLLKDLSDSLSPEQLSQFSEHITISSDKMNTLISDMLDLLTVESQFVSLDLRMVNLNDFIPRQLENHYLSAQEKSIGLHFDNNTPELHIALDVKLFSRVMDNLISNAIKYSPENTQVCVAIHKLEDGVILEIEDQGYGMSQETIDNLFVPFFRAADMQKRQIEGTGIGMAVVKEVIDRHEGQIHVQSEIGKGSIFRVLLPQKNISELVH